MGILDRFRLDGKIALVTGGAGPHFGSSITKGLAEAGAKVITASRSLERNESLAAQLRRDGHDAHALALDITDAASIQSLHDTVMGKFNRLDILVNSAVVGVGGGFEEQTAEDWLTSARGNMAGLFAMCKAFIPEMVRQGRGSIINISSIYGVVANDPTIYSGTQMKQPPNYCFVKAGMINFTRYVCNYYGRKGVRANCISPGGYWDEKMPEPFVHAYTQRVPIGRMLNHEDLKGAVVFLASDASEYVNGINLIVDGGWTSI